MAILSADTLDYATCSGSSYISQSESLYVSIDPGSEMSIYLGSGGKAFAGRGTMKFTLSDSNGTVLNSGAVVLEYSGHGPPILTKTGVFMNSPLTISQSSATRCRVSLNSADFTLAGVNPLNATTEMSFDLEGLGDDDAVPSSGPLVWIAASIGLFLFGRSALRRPSRMA